MIKLKDIIAFIKENQFIGNENIFVSEMIQLDIHNTREDVLFWCNDKNIEQIKNCKKGVVICSNKALEFVPLNPVLNYIIVENPRLVFSNVLNEFFVVNNTEAVISTKAIIHPTAKIGTNVSVGANTIIEEYCQIGDNTIIGCNNVIHTRTRIGENVKIGSNNTIGGVGFGYEMNELGQYQFIQHIGNVIIKNYVEIGNNTCIDRAVLGSTKIENNVKIDNLVHIAHGVQIDENSLIIANSMIAGSALIGKNVWISPSVSILNKAVIGDNSLVGMGAVVIKKVDKKTIVVGNPAKFLKNK